MVVDVGHMCPGVAADSADTDEIIESEAHVQSAVTNDQMQTLISASGALTLREEAIVTRQ